MDIRQKSNHEFAELKKEFKKSDVYSTFENATINNNKTSLQESAIKSLENILFVYWYTGNERYKLINKMFSKVDELLDTFHLSHDVRYDRIE